MSDRANPVFYKLPTELVRPGLSTIDGEDIVSILDQDGDRVFVEVYTPSDDPDKDAWNRRTPETRAYPLGGLVQLAAFPDSPLDMSTHPRAVPGK